MIFEDRIDAGRRLADALRPFAGSSTLVIALPRGGVPVARVIADALHAPLDLLIVRKIGVPGQPELAMGAVADAEPPLVVRNEETIRLAGVARPAFDEVRDAEIAEAKRRRERYLGTRQREKLSGRSIIVVDDGIATGSTMRAALAALKMGHPAKLIVAVPVAAADARRSLGHDADAFVCLDAPEHFGAVGAFYRHFEQVSDEEVIALLAPAPPSH